MNVKFNGTNGETIDRELLVAMLEIPPEDNLAPLGEGTTDSSEEFDWSRESNTDILGTVRTTMKKPIKTQSFDPLPVYVGGKAINYLHKLAIVDENAAALCNLKMLIVHLYITVEGTELFFAEHHDGCSIEVNSLGGEGGGNIGMPLNVTYGGTRTIGGAARNADGTFTFTPESEISTASTFSTRSTKKDEE